MGPRQRATDGARLVAAALTAADVHRLALAVEGDRREERDRAILAAVRAGAGLSEIATAAGVTRSAASLVARRTLAPRTGRGGPYARRRGATAALRTVSEAALSLEEARAESREAKVLRDIAIVASAVDGHGISETARALGLTSSAVSAIVRANPGREAMKQPGGAVASR